MLSPLVRFFGLGLLAVLGAAGCDQNNAATLPEDTTDVQLELTDAPETTGLTSAAAVVVEGDILRAFDAWGDQPQLWQASLDDQTLVIKLPNRTDLTLQVERMAFTRGSKHKGMHEGLPVAFNVVAQTCQQDDQDWSFTAELTLGAQTYTGCAEQKTLDETT